MLQYLQKEDYNKINFLFAFIKNDKKLHTKELKRVENFYARCWAFKETKLSDHQIAKYNEYEKKMQDIQALAFNDVFNSIFKNA